MNGDRALFNQSILEMLDTTKSAVRSQINSEKTDYITNINDEEYLNFITADYDYDVLNAQADSLRVVDTSEKVSHEEDNFFHERYEVRKQSLTFEIDLEGDVRMLFIEPSNRLVWSPKAYVKSHSITFIVDDWNNNQAQVKQDMETFRTNLITQLQHVNREAPLLP